MHLLRLKIYCEPRDELGVQGVRQTISEKSKAKMTFQIPDHWLNIDEEEAEEREQLKQLRKQAIAIKRADPLRSANSIADELGVCHATVIKWCRQAEVSVNAAQIKSQERRQAAIQFCLDNPDKTNQEVANKFGVNRITVGKWLRGAGISTSHPNTYPAELREKALRLRKENPKLSTYKIADAVGVSQPTVSIWLRKTQGDCL